MPDSLLQIAYRNVSNRAIAAYPVTYGVPLRRGALAGDKPLCLRQGGKTRPAQAKVLETWDDGSARWLLLDFDLPLAANERGTLELLPGRARAPGPAMKAETKPGAVTVRTPRLEATIGTRAFSLFRDYRVNGTRMVLPGSDIVVEDPHGKRFYASLARRLDVRLVESGPQRIVVQVTGRHTAEDDAELLTFRIRYTFRPREPGVAIAYKFTNREEPETGVRIASISIVVPTSLGDRTEKLVRQTNHTARWVSRALAIRENVELFAGKAVNEAARTRYGAAAEGKVLLRNFASLRENLAEYPHFLRPGNARTDMTGGLRQMYPWLGLNGKGGSAVAWFAEMEHHYPKAVRAERGTLSFDVWPSSAGELLVRRGQSKEHDLYLSLDSRPRDAATLEGVYFDHELVGVGILGAACAPVELTLDPAYVRSCEALDLHRWLRYDEARYAPVEVKLGSAGARGEHGSRGMMDFGDFINPDRSWAHNNENDAILNGIREYYRRAEPTMLPPALAKARHNAHVDFIAYDPDPLRQGTMPAHCPEHTDGATYPSHMWVEGLMAAYGVSGEPDFLEAALAVGENMLRWQKDGASVFYADSRECGWPMLAFLRLHEYTRDRKWLDACEEIFRFYRDRIDADGEIKYALPHGVGTVIQGYGEFIAWRAVFFYYERTGREDVKRFLVDALPRVYLHRPGHMVGGWACNDLFPAWAAYALTGEDRFIEDNYPFLRFLMDRPGNFPWGGVDMHYYLAELDRRGTLERFAGMPPPPVSP